MSLTNFYSGFLLLLMTGVGEGMSCFQFFSGTAKIYPNLKN